MAITVEEIFETVNMTLHQNFDIRTVTLGINLKDCMDRNIDHFCGRIEQRIVTMGQKLNTAADVYELITPSRQRALQLNKAYRAIVAEQDFVFGRDATIRPPANVYQHIDNATAPTLPAQLFYNWDIRLDWQRR